MISSRGVALVLSSPSGAGKTTLGRLVLDQMPGIRMSVSVTTRPPRVGEIDGKDYHFIDDAKFLQMRDNRRLLEWAHVFGHLYGTPREAVDEALKQGQDVLFDVDWQGAQQLYDRIPDDLVRVFILPPSLDALRQRLHDRGQDSAAVVAHRMDQAANEMSRWEEYDYVIVNADLSESLSSLLAILTAERIKRQNPSELAKLVDNLHQGSLPM